MPPAVTGQQHWNRLVASQPNWRTGCVTSLAWWPQSRLALEWREWLTRRLTDDYFRDRSFYQVQAGALVDNPDQRISSDIRCSHLRKRSGPSSLACCLFFTGGREQRVCSFAC